jgi:hypothetical protein
MRVHKNLKIPAVVDFSTIKDSATAEAKKADWKTAQEIRRSWNYLGFPKVRQIVEDGSVDSVYKSLSLGRITGSQ